VQRLSARAAAAAAIFVLVSSCAGSAGGALPPRVEVAQQRAWPVLLLLLRVRSPGALPRSPGGADLAVMDLACHPGRQVVGPE